MDRGLKSIGGEAIKRALVDAGIDKREVAGRLDVERRRRRPDRPGVHPRPGGPAQRRHGQPARRQRRERLRQRARPRSTRPAPWSPPASTTSCSPAASRRSTSRTRPRSSAPSWARSTSSSCQTILDGAAEIGRRERRERRRRKGAGENRSMFMDIYAAAARAHMAALRHRRRAVRDGLGEELLPRLAQSAGAVPRGDDASRRCSPRR